MLSSSQLLAMAILISFSFKIKHLDAFSNLKPYTEYKDVFVGSLGGKPQLGTTTATCWARGGSCIHIRFCRNYEMDVGVPGCTTNFRVCCKNFKKQLPTVGILRSPDEYADFEGSGYGNKNVMDPHCKLHKMLVRITGRREFKTIPRRDDRCLIDEHECFIVSGCLPVPIMFVCMCIKSIHQ